MRIKIFVLCLLLSACAKKVQVQAPPFGQPTTMSTPTTAPTPEMTQARADLAFIDADIKQKLAAKEFDDAEKHLCDAYRGDAHGICKKDVESFENAKKAADQEAAAIAAAGITHCPTGTVKVNPLAEQQLPYFSVPFFGRIVSIGHAVTVHVSNPSPVWAVDIETDYGLVPWAVKNLCPGGSLNLSFYLDVGDPESKQINLTAKAIRPDGTVLQDYHQPPSLQRTYNGSTLISDTPGWTINLHEIYTTR